MTEAQRQAWNAAVERRDPGEIEKLQAVLLRQIHTRIMDGDPTYEQGGWTPARG